MTIPDNVRRFLASRRGDFKIRKTSPAGTFENVVAGAELEPSQVARARVIKGGNAYLLAVAAANAELDLQKIGRLFKRAFEFADDAEVRRLFPGCDPEALPPFGAVFGVKTLQDRSLSELPAVYFCTGVPGLFVRAQRDEYARLQTEAWSQHTIAARPLSDEPTLLRTAIRKRVEEVDALPAMPGIAMEIIRLRNNPYSHASELAAIIEQDPSLSAQLIRYATSPLYGYQGKVESVQQAIVRVLGMDFVYDLAFGLSLGRTFRNPKGGALGLNAFWHHTVYCGALAQALCNAIDYNSRPSAGMAYLAGLMHNFGLLLLGHLFPGQFARLNDAVAREPNRLLIDIEREVIGVTHMEMGLWLMESWDMPREIVEAVSEHHNPHHYSDYSVYANLVYIANALLARMKIGDTEGTEIPAPLLARVGLDAVRVEVALAMVMEDKDGLDFIAQKMAA